MKKNKQKDKEEKGHKENIHDHNFKHNFTKKDVARDFLKHNLPKEILEQVDLESVTIENNEFIPTRYRKKRHVDVLYSLKYKDGRTIYTLIHLEAQSKHDPDMALRIWEYQVAIGRFHFDNKNKKIPLILTFVLYHGEEEWTSAKSIAELFEDVDTYIAISWKSPFLINLTKEDLKRLQEQGAAAVPQIIMKQQSIGAYCEILGILYPLMKKYGQDSEENIDYMATNDKHGEDDFLKNFRKFDPKKAKYFKIMFEQAILRERNKALTIGIQKGIERGIEQGIQRGIERGREQGIQRGMEQGREEGRKEGIDQLKQQLIAEGLITQEQAQKII